MRRDQGRWNVSGCQWRMQGADLRLTQQLIEAHLANLFGYSAADTPEPVPSPRKNGWAAAPVRARAI
jgi:hypothetical protein